MGDEEEAARIAFEQFMISGGTQNSSGGKKKKKKKKSRNDSQTPTKSPSQHKPPRRQGGSDQRQSSTSKRHQFAKNAERQYWRIYNTFCAIVKNGWIDIDDQLEDVVGSIANIRGRLPMETRMLNRMSEQANKGWTGHGYNVSTQGDTLTRGDVELAMAHDLSQHEKMLAAMRKLMSSLSECQDTLGRQVDEIMLHHAETSAPYQEAGAVDGEVASASATPVAVLVDEMSDIFSMLAMELFRKQSLSQNLLDSVTNDILEGGRDAERDVVDHVDSDDDGLNSLKAARCCREWPRRSKHSCIDLKTLNTALRRCERPDR